MNVRDIEAIEAALAKIRATVPTIGTEAIYAADFEDAENFVVILRAAPELLAAAQEVEARKSHADAITEEMELRLADASTVANLEREVEQLRRKVEHAELGYAQLRADLEAARAEVRRHKDLVDVMTRMRS